MNIGHFDAELNPLAWFDTTAVVHGWWDYGMLFQHDLITGTNPIGTRKTWIELVVSGIPAGHSVTRADLSLECVEHGGGISLITAKAFTPTDTSWLETEPTFDTPLAGAVGAQLGSTAGINAAGQIAVFDLKAFITGNGTYVIQLENTAAIMTAFGSREHPTAKPSLTIASQTGLGTCEEALEDANCALTNALSDLADAIAISDSLELEKNLALQQFNDLLNLYDQCVEDLEQCRGTLSGSISMINCQ